MEVIAVGLALSSSWAQPAASALATKFRVSPDK